MTEDEAAPVVRVLLADDHPIYRMGLRALLDLEGIEVVGEAQTGQEAVAEAATLRPDVVVMDVRMPLLNGIDATKRIVAASPEVAVLVLTNSDDDGSILDAMLAGARGYVLKDAGKDAIIRAIHDVARGGVILGASIAGRLPRLLAKRAEDPTLPFDDLTRRELEVLELMARGLNNGAIATRLGVGDKRVRNCVTDIYNKLGVSDRAQAIILAREAGLGTAPPDQQ